MFVCGLVLMHALEIDQRKQVREVIGHNEIDEVSCYCGGDDERSAEPALG